MELFRPQSGMATYIERLQLSVPLPQDPPLEPPRRSLSSLVCDEFLARNGKDVIKLLSREKGTSQQIVSDDLGVILIAFYL